METKNILIYGGVFDIDSIEMLLYQAKKRMDIHGASISVKKKLFNIIVECLDNIQKHTDAITSQLNGNYKIKQSVDHSFFSFDFNLIDFIFISYSFWVSLILSRLLF